MTQRLIHLFKYNQYSNSLIIEKAQQLSSEQLHENRNIRGNSLFGLLYHMLESEWFWRKYCQQQSIPAQVFFREDFSDLIELWDHWQMEASEMFHYLESNPNLDQLIPRPWENMQPKKITRWRGLMYIILHNMQHRSEAAVMLTDLGFSPGNLDFITFE